MEVDTCIKLLNKDMNKCLDKGEPSHYMAVFESTWIQKSHFGDEQKATMSDLDGAIKKLEEDLKKKQPT